MRSHASRRKSGAFTLIELLVVISIIALLIGLLLPSLSAAKAVAISAKCLANQHSLGIAMANYEADNQGAIPGIQCQYPLSLGTCGPGELGATANGYYGNSLGWREGQQIYATFDKGQGNSYNNYGSPVYNIGTDGPFTANSATTPPNNEYCAPCGLGYLGTYVSPDGTLGDVSGKVFYCPGTPASFGPFASTAYGGIGTYYDDCAYFSERGGAYGGGLYSTFLADWNQQPGGSSANVGTVSAPIMNPEVFSTYIYREGHYYDSVTSDGHVVTEGQIDTWHSMAPNDGDGYPKSDAPYLNGECYVVCDSEIACAFPYAYTYSPSFVAGLTSFTDNACHLGKSVNRGFHDGSSRVFSIPAGQVPPYAVSAIVMAWDVIDDFSCCYAPPMMEVSGVTGYGYQCWPYYWAVLDGPGVYAANP